MAVPAVNAAEKARQAAGLVYTPIDTIPATVDRLRAQFLTNKTRNVAFRKKQLQNLVYGIRDRRDQLKHALHQDLGRDLRDTDLFEIIGMTNEIVELINHIDKWAADEHVWAGITWATHGTTIRKDPNGTVLVLSAWNYPLTLAITPLAQAIATGNTVILKPSEVAANTARELTILIEQYLDPESYAVVNGAVPETSVLLDQRFEHIFYTGSGGVGRIIQEKAAKYLCPVTLELGGKSPVWVDESADLSVAAPRILWGKTANAGQTCIAPDYVLTTQSTLPKLIAALKKAADDFYPAEGGAKEAHYYTKIINENHASRLASLLADTKGTIVLGGHTDVEKKLIEPTIVTNVTGEDSLMKGELFGPILPIIALPDVQAGIDFINARDQPLALYVFAEKAISDKILANTRSGSAVVGDVLIQFLISELPFGGTGPSGFGAYHGKTGFDLFTHQRALVRAPHSGFLGKIVELAMKARYPPVSHIDIGLFSALLGKRISFARPQDPHSLPAAKVSFWKFWNLKSPW